MRIFHPHARRQRAKAALLITALGLGVLGAAFFRVQVVRGDRFTLRSEANRLRPITMPAPRGTIYDQDGEILAGNIPGYTLLLMPMPEDSLRIILHELTDLLAFDSMTVAAALKKYEEFPNRPIAVQSELTFDQVSAVAERRIFFPRVLIEMRPRRRYPAGPTAAHLVGYVSEISQSELDAPEFAGYHAGRRVGKFGIERQYEVRLSGKPGIRYVEVDALGRIIGGRTGEPEVPPEPGRDLRLYLDLDTQRWIHRIFPDDMRGAVVAIEPKTGHVVAMYSRPSFDPNVLVGGVAPEEWRSMVNDPADPLVHRAVAGRYAPGSTFKLVTAAAALELGVVDPDRYMPIPCRGGMRYGNRYFRCWEEEGHGYLSLTDALAQSCNVYFYQLGVKVGLDRLLDYANRMGFNQPTGIDLPAELSGTVPTGSAWYRERYGWKPTPSEVLNLAIGQGPNSQTVLGMAHLYAAVANGGFSPTPRLAATPEPERRSGLDLQLSDRTLKLLKQGMLGVLGSDGTATVAQLEHWEFAGKTGTAQNPQGDAHAWFVGMAGPEGEPPEVVVAVLLEHGEHGWIAAQYAAKTADYYLRRQHGMPIDTVQTYRDHLFAGKPAPWAEPIE